MPSLRLPFVAAFVAAVAFVAPATATAALTPYLDPINVAPDAPPLGQSAPDVAMADDGRFAVSYLETSADTSSTQVWVQRFDASLNKAGARIPVGPVGMSNTPDANVAMAADGRFAVAYLVFPDVSNGRVEIQRFGADGAPAGGAILADAPGQVINMTTPPAIAMADDGRFAVAWVARSGADQILRVRVFDAAGAPVTAPLNVDLNSRADAHPSIGMAGDGRFLVSWYDYDFPPPGDPLPNGALSGALFNANGTIKTSPVTIWQGSDTGTFRWPSVGMADDGSAFVAFQGIQSGGFEQDVWARRLDAAMTPLGSRFGVSTYTAYSQVAPDVAVDRDGDAFAAFEGQVGTQQWSYLRHFGADGTPDGGELHVGTSSSGDVQKPQVATDGAARTAFAWTVGASGRGVDVYVARYNYAPVSDPGGPGPGPGPDPTPATPAPVGGTGTPPAKPAAPGAKPLTAAQIVAQSVSFPPTRSCASRRNFKIRLRVPKGGDVTQAVVKVNGRRVAVRRGSRLRSTVDLRSLPKGRFTVTIELKLAAGRVVKGERKYKTCAKKQRGGKPRV